MRLAITTDWLVTLGGAERVITQMHALWPDAPIFTTVYKEGSVPPLQQATVHPSSLQFWYKLIRSHRPLLPLMPSHVESWDLRGYDVILSSSHAVAKGCIPPPSARHICYCHTPMRYAWDMEERYLDDFRLQGPLRALARRQLRKLRRWDLTTTKRVDLFIANSQTTQERIQRIYNRDSVVLHPPVDDRFFQIPLNKKRTTKNQPPYFVAVGRLVPYKRFDLLIEVANRGNLPLKIAGSGPDFQSLKRLVASTSSPSATGASVQFLGYVPEDDLPTLYRDARALIFPTEEDAGIAPLEAQACGIPVIAFGKGGVLDTVEEGRTGLFFSTQTVEALTEALQRFEQAHFDPYVIREHARKFSSERFREKLRDIVHYRG